MPSPDELLHTGDLILLKFRKENDKEFCFISCDGIVDTTAGVVATFDVNNIPDIRDCLFCVTYKLSYNAKKDFDKKRKEGVHGHELHAMRDNLDKEESQNAEKLEMRCPLTYGESIQLLHVKSGKFLSIMPRQTAAQDKQSRKVVLKEGGVHSAFRIAPFYLHRFMGDPIVFNEQFILKGFKLARWNLYANGGQYLPHAVGQPQGLEYHEMNCSTKLCGFFPIMYSRNPDTLNYASTVRFYHSQSGCFLGASGDGKKRPFMRKLECSNYESPLNLWSKGCWVLEPSDRLHGGAATWRALFCLKHIASGKYLSVERSSKPIQGTLKAIPDSTCFFSLDPIETVDGTEVQLDGSSKVKGLVKYEDATGPLWLSVNTSILKDKPPGSGAQDRPSLKLLFMDQRRVREAVQVECLNRSFPSFVEMVNAVAGRKNYAFRTVEQLKEYPRKAIQAGKNHEDLTSVVKAEEIERKVDELFFKINDVLTSSIFFLTGDEEIDDALHCSSTSLPDRQRIVKDLKYIDATVRLKEALKSAGYWVDSLTSRTVVPLGLPGQILPDTPPLNAAQILSLKLLVEHWRTCFQDNRMVEDYFDKHDWVKMLNEFNGRGLGAPKALGALVSNNFHLVKKIDPMIIEQFVSFISNLGPDEMWPNFMTSVSSCQGIALPAKQSLVLRMMYYPGALATAEHKKEWGGNKEQLLLGIKMSEQSVAPFPIKSVPQMLSKDLISGGVRDLLVSWVTEEEPWAIGKDFLYFHPFHLKLKFTQGSEKFTVGKKLPKLWVKLSEIAWVLNPERTYAVVHNVSDDAWDKEGPKIRETARFQALMVLSTYYVSQLDMLAEICMDRAIHSLTALEPEYQFDLMVCGLYHYALAPPLRRAFCSLTINLWLDRHPQYRLKMPDVIHKLDGREVDSTGLPKYELLDTRPDEGKSWEFYTMKEATKFHILFMYAKHHLTLMRGRVVHSHEGHNAYTAEVIEMMNCLAEFGFFENLTLVQELMRAVLACMDGRTDWLEAPMVNLEAPTNRGNDAEPYIAPGGTPGRQGSRELTAGPNGGDPNGGYIRLTQQKPGFEDERPLFLDIEDPSDGVNRYPSNPRNDKVHNIKSRMLKLCERILEFSVNSGIAMAVDTFKKEAAGNSGGAMSEQVVIKLIGFIKNSDYDFDVLLGGSTNTMLLDLLVYASADVFSRVIRVLRTWNHRVEITVTKLHTVRLLVEKEEFAKYDILKKDAFRLTNLIHTHETWGIEDAFSGFDTKTIEECKELLTVLRQICSVGGEGNDVEVPDAGMQDTLAGFGLGSELCNAFNIPLAELTGKARQICIDIMKLTCQLCVQYVNRHPANQLELFQKLDLMTPWFPHGIGVANVVGAIFTGNRKLCENLPSSILYDIAGVLQENRSPEGLGFLPHQLAFFQAVVVVGDRPITKNKMVLLDILKNPQFDKVLHVMPGPEGKARRKQLLQGFESWGELTKPQMFRQWKGGDGEIQYHNRSMELLAMMCVGRDTSGSTAWVQSLVPALDLAQEYMDVDQVQQACATGKPNSNDIVGMCRVLKSTLLTLLELCYYNSMLQDDAFQVSSIHARLLKSLNESLIRLEPSVKSGDMNKLDCDFLIRVLKTIVAYCEFGNRKLESAEITKLISNDIKNILQRFYAGSGTLPTKNSLFKAAVARALGYISNDMLMKKARLMEDVTLDADDSLSSGTRSVTMNADFQGFVTSFANHVLVKDCIANDHQKLVGAVTSIGSLTNTTDLAFKKELQSAKDKGTPLKDFDYRRNQVTLDEIVHRVVTHCLVPEHLKEWQITEFSLKLLNDILIQTREDEVELERLQNKYCQSGAVQLVVDILMQKPDSTVIQLSISLGCRLLQPNNKFCQQAFVDYFYLIDDSGLWRVLDMLYDQVISNIKYVRSRKQMKLDAKNLGINEDEMLTHSEANVLKIFSTDLLTCISAMKFQQVFCEGHNLMMQNYIFNQVDNTESFNFVEKTVDLFTKMCKNEKAADIIDAEEADVAQQSLDLLVEVTTGPCTRNQEFLCTCGIVETAQKILRAPFLFLRSCTQEAYPPEVRQMKQRMVALLQILLELRHDVTVQRNVVFRTDTESMKDRLMFIHRWVLGDRLGLNKDAVKVTEESNWYATIDDLEADDGIVVPDMDPTVLLDSAGFVEEDLGDYFNEAFGLVILKRSLSDVNEAFKESTDPSISPFKDDHALYVNDEQYQKAKHANGMELKYLAAYDFFNCWINVIEVVVEGKLHDYLFRMPMLCNFVLGRAKLDISNNVSIESPEDKAKDFCSMVNDAYAQTVHTREMSKWSCCCIRPFNFFLKNDSKNLMSISEYCLGLATVLNFCLFAALSLVDDTDTIQLPFMVDFWIPYINGMGALYTVMMFCAMLVVICTYAPLEYAALADEIGEKGSTGVLKTLFGLAMIVVTVLGVLWLLLPSSALPTLPTAPAPAVARRLDSSSGSAAGPVIAGVCGVFMLLHVGGRWAADGSSCPNNPIAKMIGTAHKSMNQQPVSRRVYLTAFSVAGNFQVFYMYSFLLLDLLFLSPMLQNVILAVTQPLTSLILTTMVGLIVMYEYAVIGFYFFRPDYDGSCNSMLDCTTTTIYQGLRMDIGSAIAPIGVGDDMRWYMRMGFDLSYFVVISTILMNVIFGIIIDTFGSLRDATQERDDYMKNNTFISCIDRGEVDKAAQAANLGSGFDYLEKVKQNRWNYLNFIFYLKRKDSTELTGPETKINALIDDEDVTWMPLTVCRLMEEPPAEDSEITKLDAKVVSLDQRLKTLEESSANIIEIVTLHAGGEEEVEKMRTRSKLRAHDS